jgi:hypothetical protein
MRPLDNRRRPRENGSQLGAAFEDLTRDEEDDRRSSGGGIAMTFTLSRLAPGSYDVLLNGMIVASLVRSGETDNATWTAELLEDVHPRRRPAPFKEAEHTFSSLEEAQTWLGGAEIRDAGLEG